MERTEAIKMADTDMALLSVGISAFAVPLEQAIQILRLFKDARKFEKRYQSSEERTIGGSEYKYYIGGTLPDIAVEIMPSEVYVEGLVNGART